MSVPPPLPLFFFFFFPFPEEALLLFTMLLSALPIGGSDKNKVVWIGGVLVMG